jgi:hypothetical protein
METRIQIVALVASGALLLGILELVRRRKLLERYALLWIFSATVLLALAAWAGLLEWVAETVGIRYAPSALFVIAFGFILILLLHFSIAVSRLSDQTKVLAQRLALLEERVRQAEGEAADAEDARATPSTPVGDYAEEDDRARFVSRAGRS